MKDAHMECGVGSCRPRVLQRCTTVTSFVGVFCTSAILTSTCMTYLSSQITTLEKYFGFSSSQSGFLLSCNDIGFLLLTLIISNQVRRLHIPRVLAISTILFGVAAVICCLPYFISLGDQNLAGDNDDIINNPAHNQSVKMDPMALILLMHAGQLCTVNGTDNCLNSSPEVTSKEIKVGTPTSFTTVALVILAVGLIIQGIGKAPRQPFLTCYIDDNGDKTKTALYLGILTGCGILGPAIAFGLGGVFAKIYITLEKVDITPMDPRWVGAWWLGFIIFGILAIFSGIPVMFFPRRLKVLPVWLPQKQKTTPKLALQDLFRAIFKLFHNPVYILIVTFTVIDILGVSGFLAFTPKYMETQFFIPAWKSNILMGLMGVLSAGIGSCLGGLIVTKFKFTPMMCLKFLMVTTTVFIACGITNFFVGCKNPVIVGFNASPSILNNITDGSACYANCGCDRTDYFPVCGSDGRSYFSPCFAGCNGREGLRYVECGCLGTNGTVTPGLCPTECNMLPGFMVTNFIGGFVGCLGIIPGYMFTIRSVSDSEKGLAVALVSFLTSILGWIPGPVIFGKIVDTVCEVWSSTCTSKGACAKYDIEEFRMKRATFETLLGVVLITFEIALYFVAKKKTDWSTEAPGDDMEYQIPEFQKMVDNSFPDINSEKFKWTNGDTICKKPTILRTFKGSIKNKV